MNQDYIIPNAWSIIEEGFEKNRVKSSESLFSIGNGAMGQRANFEEFYSGDTFQGSYIAGVYYPDKTKVGWWKNGYPEYFAKVLNAPVWIGIDIEINGEQFDLNTCKEVKNFRRELNMKEGTLNRSFYAILPSGLEIEVNVCRFLSADLYELGVINYDIKPLNGGAKIVYKPYVDAHVKNEDANWEEIFWESIGSEIKGEQGFVQARTFKTHFNVVTYMQNAIFINDEKQQIAPTHSSKTDWKVEFTYEVEVKANEVATIQKFGGYIVSTNHQENELISAAENVLAQANQLGYQQLLINQKEAWAKTWEMADITIEGDVKAQQGIRFNIFQLNQTYSGKDARLNIGPKGFTAIAFAIFNYTRFTGDESYIPEAGLEVLLGIARFWKQRVNWSNDKKQYVMLGVTGPNEYENNVNNNFHSNYCAQWCMNYLVEQVENIKTNYPQDYTRIVAKTNVNDVELAEMKEVAANIYFPFSEEYDVYLQQDGFLDKDLTPVSELPKEERPINQKWSWDRILRSAYIKQADTLQAFYYFEDQFSKDQLEKHFDFYEPLTVHESSLSPCVHSIQAATLGRMEQAYTFYLRTSRLDLDDYNKEVHEGLHITSMAGTWMSIVEGFGGMRVKNDTLYFEPRLPEQWEGFSFKINFRNQILKVIVNKGETTFELEGAEPLTVYVFGEKFVVQPSI